MKQKYTKQYSLYCLVCYYLYMKRGFSLLEVLVVIAIIGILSSIILATLSTGHFEARLVETKQEMKNFRQALQMYLTDHGEYPDDVDRSVPPELMGTYLIDRFWPEGSWPNTTYDWDAWNTNTDNPIYQITLRCGDKGNKSDDCEFIDKTEWDNAGSCTANQNSSIYFCIQGDCVPHIHDNNTCGKCLNKETMPSCAAPE